MKPVQSSSQEPGLGAALMDGALWKTSSKVLATVVGVLGQFILGWVLSENDFGIYAVAISAAWLVRGGQDGGVGRVLMRLTPLEFRRHARTGLAISAASSLLMAMILVVASGPIATFYNEPEVQRLLLVLAVAAPLSFVWPVASAGLHGALAFRTVSILELIAALMQPVLTVAFALYGLGPMSFVIPVVFVAAFYSIAGWIALRRSDLTPTPGFVAGREFLTSSPWAIGGTFATVAYANIDNLILGRIVSTATLGFYYFAYQIVLKILSPLDSLWGVTMPGFAAMAGNTERTQTAIQTAGLASGGLYTPIFMGVAVVASPMMNLIWGDKWDLAASSVAALSLATAAVLFIKLAETLVQAHGKFATWTAIVLARAALIGTSAAIGATLVEANDPTPAAIAVAFGMVLGSLAMVAVSCRSVGVSPAPSLRAFGAPFAHFVVGGLLLLALERTLSLGVLPTTITMSVGALLWSQLGYMLLLRRTASGLRALIGDRPRLRLLGYVYGFGWTR